MCFTAMNLWSRTNNKTLWRFYIKIIIWITDLAAHVIRPRNTRGQNQCRPLLFHHCYHILFQCGETIHLAIHPPSQQVINHVCIMSCWCWMLKSCLRLIRAAWLLSTSAADTHRFVSTFLGEQWAFFTTVYAVPPRSSTVALYDVER